MQPLLARGAAAGSSGAAAAQVVGFELAVLIILGWALSSPLY
jgi:hypothetical protein